MASYITKEDGGKILLESAGALLLETSSVSTIIGKTGTGGTAVMQKTKASWTNVSQKTGSQTPIAQKAVAGYTQVTGH